MDGELVDRYPVGGKGLQQPRDMTGGSHADGVADGQLGRAEIDQAPPDPSNLVDRHVAFPWVAERHRDVRPDVDAGRAGPGHGRLEHRELVVKAAVEVAPRERLGGAAEDGDVGDPGLQCTVQTPLVRHQDGQRSRPVEVYEIDQLLGVGELWHPARVDEARDLHDRQAGGDEPGDELGLDLHRDDHGLVL